MDKIKNKILSNYVWQTSYNLLVIILPIITVPIVSRALGPSGIGLYNYVNSIVSYFTLVAGLGLATYGVREIALVKEYKGKLLKKFWELAFLNLIFSFLSLLVYVIIAIISSKRI